MFTKPKHGWSEFEIEDFTFPVSYLNNTPQDCIDAFCFSLENKHMPFCITIDGESMGECYIVSTWETVVVFCDENDNLKSRSFNISKETLAALFIKDIEECYEDWQDWLCYQDKKVDYDLSKLKSLLNQSN